MISIAEIMYLIAVLIRVWKFKCLRSKTLLGGHFAGMNITDRFDCRVVYWISQFSKSNLLMFQLLVICLWLSVCVLRDFSMQIHFARITLCTAHIPGAHYSYFISDAILSHTVLNHFGCGETCSNKRIPSDNLWYRIFLRPIS